MTYTPPQPNKFEIALSKFAPGFALKRYRERVAFSYEGARMTRLRGSPTHNPNPETPRESYDRIKLMEQVRDLVENLPLAQSILTKLGNYALGELQYQPRSADPAWNRACRDYLSEWFADCDVSGRFQFADMARIALYSYLRDGDHFWVWRETEDGLKLQAIESDRVGGSQPKISDGEASGILYNRETGRPTAYRIFSRTQAGGYTEEQIITADSVIPFYDHLRYDQYRGITAFAPSITCMRDYKELMEATRIGVKFENYHSGFTFSENGAATDSTDYFAASADKTANGQPLAEFSLTPGTVKHLPNTARIDLIKSDRPSGQFQAYSEMLVREILLALDLPSGFGWNLEKLGGPGARMDAAQAYRKIRYIQKSVIEPRINRVVRAVILRGMAEGRLATREDYKVGQWQFPAMPTIDVGRDSAAGINEVRAGLLSKADWFAESGKDVEQEEQEIATEATALIERAKAIAEETGFPVERVVDMLDMRIGNGTPSIILPSEDSGENKPLISSIGISGTQALSDLIANVGAGAISPVAARALLRSVFGMSEDQSAEIFPPADDAIPRTPPEDAPAPSAPPAEAEFDAGSFRPNAAMAKNARRALEVRQEKPASQRGMTPVGLARARDISNRRPLSLETVRRMKAYFDRHAVDKEGETWSEQGKGWQAWNGWGGDEGRTWANAIVQRANADEMHAAPVLALSAPMRQIMAAPAPTEITDAARLDALQVNTRRNLDSLRLTTQLSQLPGYVPDEQSAEISTRLNALLQRISESTTQLEKPNS
jgi:capsid protein